ncbi:hypothetical protein HYS94_02140 [Candidatus Daviesbacteria bacterium]|nr:hypothetical protein [Candidatus Daviesbacteria bacterium]
MKRILDEIKYFIQRGRRGWSDRDIWDFESYLHKILAGGLTYLAKSENGHPCRLIILEGQEEWTPDNCSNCHCAENWDKELRDNAEKFRKLCAENEGEFFKEADEIYFNGITDNNQDEWGRLVKKGFEEKNKICKEAWEWLKENHWLLWD